MIGRHRRWLSDPVAVRAHRAQVHFHGACDELPDLSFRLANRNTTR
jgi:hypothetical protein